jgi:hypothetical protein
LDSICSCTDPHLLLPAAPLLPLLLLSTAAAAAASFVRTRPVTWRGSAMVCSHMTRCQSSTQPTSNKATPCLLPCTSRCGEGDEEGRCTQTQTSRDQIARTPRSSASGCGWRRGHGAITTKLFTRACPSSTPAPPTQLSKRTCGVPTSAKSARRATSSSPSPSVRQGAEAGAGTTTHEAGNLPDESSYFLKPPWLIQPAVPGRRRRCGGAAVQVPC